MFQRVIYEDWTYCIPIIAFFIFAGKFLSVTIRAMCLGEDERKRLAALPLDDQSDNPNPLNSDNP